MKHFYRIALFGAILAVSAVTGFAQKGDVRGYVLDKSNGQPLPFITVQLNSKPPLGSLTDINGFFNIAEVEFGTYQLSVSAVGYDSTATTVTLDKNNKYPSVNLNVGAKAVQIGVVEITDKREAAKNDVRVSVERVTPLQIKSLPSTGGEPDLVQYLQVLPGVIFTGDQGGQLYIRGGSPVQTKILLDGMTVYNPFHSIGFFSVFETEAIRTANVYTGGFGAEYGGRTSAVVDVQYREGNKKRFSGLIGASPFQTKLILEGPIVPLNDEGTSMSYLLMGKYSYLPQSSKVIYPGVNNGNGLPFSYFDGYGKISFNAKNGSNANVFGFNFTDGVQYNNIANLAWNSSGGGLNFKLIPGNAKTIFSGRISASNYSINLTEADGKPRRSSVGGFEAGLNFMNYGTTTESNYGFELNGFRTTFEYVNPAGYGLDKNDNNTELAGYFKEKIKIGGDKLILEPSLRIHYYASLPEASIEPRFGMKWNITDKVRFKFAGGYFTQNLISAVSERDIVNLFVGFLSSPDDVLVSGQRVKGSSLLQKSWHAISGVEYDVNKHFTINVEPYYKWYPQLISLNRTKRTVNDPEFQVETGDAYGIDFSFKYVQKKWNVTTNYSYAFVTRNDGTQTYPTSFDRRHNINIFGNYVFGKARSWEAGVRWNFGTGFPFTLTKGFYDNISLATINDSPITANGDIGIIYDETRNGGRLPSYHRLDLSLKKSFSFGKYAGLDITASATNAYDRRNIFYFDRVRYTRVDQLPLLPSLAIQFKF